MVLVLYGSSHKCEVTHPLCWGPCVSIGKKGENHFFSVHVPPSSSSPFSGQRESPTPVMSQPLASSAVIHGRNCPGCMGIPTLQPQLPDDGSLHSDELSVSPEVPAMQDQPLASESPSPVDSSFFPPPPHNVLLHCCSFPSLYFFPTAFLKISPSLFLVGANELILLCFFQLCFLIPLSLPFSLLVPSSFLCSVFPALLSRNRALLGLIDGPLEKD